MRTKHIGRLKALPFGCVGFCKNPMQVDTVGAIPNIFPPLPVKEENPSARPSVSVPRSIAPFCAAAVAAGESLVDSDQESFHEPSTDRLAKIVRDTSSPQNSEVRRFEHMRRIRR